MATPPSARAHLVLIRGHDAERARRQHDIERVRGHSDSRRVATGLKSAEPAIAEMSFSAVTRGRHRSAGDPRPVADGYESRPEKTGAGAARTVARMERTHDSQHCPAHVKTRPPAPHAAPSARSPSLVGANFRARNL
jgi:hypothetical protein